MLTLSFDSREQPVLHTDDYVLSTILDLPIKSGTKIIHFIVITPLQYNFYYCSFYRNQDLRSKNKVHYQLGLSQAVQHWKS